MVFPMRLLVLDVGRGRLRLISAPTSSLVIKLHIWSKGFSVVISRIRVHRALGGCQRGFRVWFNHSGQFICKLEPLDFLIMRCIRDLFTGYDIDVPIVAIGKLE